MELHEVLQLPEDLQRQLAGGGDDDCKGPSKGEDKSYVNDM